MKQGVLLMAVLLLFACNKEYQDPDQKRGLTISEGFCLVIGDSMSIQHTEIDYYDLSTHIVYLKEDHAYFSEDTDWDAAFTRFTVFADRDSIYSGALWPMWSSAIYEGPCIHWPSFFPPFAIKISSSYPGFYEDTGSAEDPRMDYRITKALKKFDQLREGLSCTLDQVELLPGNKLSFSFTISNLDDENYYILSPDRMGMELFHYFTNGLYLWNESTGYLEHKSDVEMPEPWDSWSSSWFELLEGKQSLSFSIHYTDFDPVREGSYQASFQYPGLHHVTKGEIHRTNGRIWLGGIRVNTEITFQ